MDTSMFKGISWTKSTGIIATAIKTKPSSIDPRCGGGAAAHVQGSQIDDLCLGTGLPGGELTTTHLAKHLRECQRDSLGI